MVPSRLLYVLACMGIFGNYMLLQGLLVATLPQPLFIMFNQSLQNHYGFILSDTGASTIISLYALIGGIGVTISIIYLFPLMDTRGRKFTSVTLSSLLGAIVAIIQMLSYWLVSIELFLISLLLVAVYFPINSFGSILYLSESVEDGRRGFASSLLLNTMIIGNLIMYTLCLPSLFGNEELWYYIPFISLVMSLGMYLSLMPTPESPKWLIQQGKISKARKAIEYFHGTDKDIDEKISLIEMEINMVPEDRMTIKEVWKDETCRQSTLIILVFAVLHNISPTQAELNLKMLIQLALGLSVEQALTINMIIIVACSPLNFIGSFMLDRYGRRAVFMISSGLMYFKILLMVVGTSVAFFSGPDLFTQIAVVLSEVLSTLFSCSGTLSLSTLLVAEIIPPAARVAVGQAISIFPLILTTSCGMIYSMMLNFFSPSLYLFFAVVQPACIIYLLKNLPETNQKPVFEILQNQETLVKSRRNTLIITEKTSLLRSRNNTLTSNMSRQYA